MLLMPLFWERCSNLALGIYAYIHAFDLHVLSVCISVHYIQYGGVSVCVFLCKNALILTICSPMHVCAYRLHPNFTAISMLFVLLKNNHFGLKGSITGMLTHKRTVSL